MKEMHCYIDKYDLLTAILVSSKQRLDSNTAHAPWIAVSDVKEILDRIEGIEVTSPLLHSSSLFEFDIQYLSEMPGERVYRSAVIFEKTIDDAIEKLKRVDSTFYRLHKISMKEIRE